MKVVRQSKAKSTIARIRRHAFKAVSTAAEVGLHGMLSRVPVDKGDLRSTCIVRDDKQGHAMMMAGGPSQISDREVDYELHVEFGTVNMAAQPFFRPSALQAKNALKRNSRDFEG